MTACQITVTGHVQGVGFRYACCACAQTLGVAGWVRNAADGSVEIHAEGTTDAVEALLAWCHEGPPGARVRQVVVNPAAAKDLREFTVRYSMLG